MSVVKWYERERDERILRLPDLSGGELEQLVQLKTATWDGNLNSKPYRTSLVKKGLVAQFEGWQVITKEGLAVLQTLGYLKA